MAFVLITVSCVVSGSGAGSAGCNSHIEAIDLQLFQCLVLAPRIIAKWAEGHPKRSIKRFMCVPEPRIKFYLNNQA
ncbi:hypothetical protein DEV91_101504 [Phyllobacterium brassicacearum]|nr:hypothetical protein DEV91_101504 [Phyllobacterium brassicacearum]